MTKKPRRGLLNGVPEKAWPDAVVNHGVRILVLLTLAFGTTALFPDGPGINVGQYQLGVVADRDVIAQVAFPVLEDPDVLARQRDSAEALVPSTFRYRPEVADSVAAELAAFFTLVDSASGAGGTAGVAGVLSRSEIEASAAEVALLSTPAGSERIRVGALTGVENHLTQGVMAPAQAATIGDSVRLVREGAETVVARDDVLSGREFYDRVLAGVDDEVEASLLRKILGRYFEHTLVLDEARTERERSDARDSVPLVVANVLEGEAIVRANQQVGPTELQKLESYRSELRSQGISVDGSDLQGALGEIILNTMVFAIFGLLVYLFRPTIYQHFRTLLLVAGLLAIYFLAGRVLQGQGIPPAALPVVFVAISLAILWDGRLALLTTFVLASVTVLQDPFASIDVFILVLIGGAAASFSVRAFRRLAQTWLFIAITVGAYALAIFGLQLRNVDFPLLSSLGAAVASTVIGAILAIGFLPVFEWFTGITSDQTLLGWTDTNRPLLRRLAMEAPGTYSHTMQVANLAETAAEAIGANSLLCRVGMYYHDIGKMLKPQYFIENQHGGTNPHDRLDPVTSAAVVREHVVEGIRLARKEKVPPSVVDFIAEHHGDQTISFFYRKAKEAAEERDAEPPDVKKFRYPGPKPRTRETAIAMLADSTESATRALQDPTEDRIRELVKNLFASRVQGGQLDDSPLTLKDLSTLERHFSRTLSSIHHQRIDYPETKHLTDRDPQGRPPPEVQAPGDPQGPGAQEEAQGGEAPPPPATAGPPEDDQEGKEPGADTGAAPQVRSLMWEDEASGEGDGS